MVLVIIRGNRVRSGHAGFQQPGNEFVLKELAIFSLLDKSDSKVFMFKESFPWKRLMNKYRKLNFSLQFKSHDLSWNFGNISYTEIGNMLKEYLSDTEKGYVKSEMCKE